MNAPISFVLYYYFCLYNPLLIPLFISVTDSFSPTSCTVSLDTKFQMGKEYIFCFSSVKAFFFFVSSSCVYFCDVTCSFRCCTWMWRRCCKEKELRARTIQIGLPMYEKFPINVIRNQKYSTITFLFMVGFFENILY